MRGINKQPFHLHFVYTVLISHKQLFISLKYFCPQEVISSQSYPKNIKSESKSFILSPLLSRHVHDFMSFLSNIHIKQVFQCICVYSLLSCCSSGNESASCKDTCTPILLLNHVILSFCYLMVFCFVLSPRKSLFQKYVKSDI